MADYRCSFCRKRQDQVRKLVAGPTPNIMICDECVVLCKEIIDREFSRTPGPEPAPRRSSWLDRLRRMAIALPR